MNRLESTRIPRFSIIIPHKDSPYVGECITRCLNLEYPDYEIIVVTNSPISKKYPDVMELLTAEGVPAKKRDMATQLASGEICAFLDDDAYPRNDWLRNAAIYFQKPEIVAVGGPAVTPEEDDLMQKASGIVYSVLPLSHRYVPKKNKWIRELPTSNFIVRKSILETLGGFGTRLRSGGDSLLCAKLLASGGKILYASDVLVYHHRRPLFRRHLMQVWGYGLHRGWLAKKIGAHSRTSIYFLPSFGLIAALILALASVFDRLILSFLLGIISALSLVILTSIVRFTRQPRLIFLCFLGSVATIATYGVAFLKGLLSSQIVYKNQLNLGYERK